MKLRVVLSVFISAWLLFVSVNSGKAGALPARLTEQSTAVGQLVVSAVEDGIVPLPVRAAENVPVTSGRPYPVSFSALASFPFSLDNRTARSARYVFTQPALYAGSPPLYIANCLLLI